MLKMSSWVVRVGLGKRDIMYEFTVRIVSTVITETKK